MKTIISFLCLLVLGTATVAAQFGVPQRGQSGYTPPPRPQVAVEPEAPDPNLLSLERANLYQELLQIDDFQKEVLKTFLKEFYEKKGEITFNEDLKFEDKQKAINVEQANLEKRLLDVFTKEQVETIINEEQFGSKRKQLAKEKKKKKRKRKRDKS